MVKRKDRTGRRQILQLNDEQTRPYSQQVKDIHQGPSQLASSYGDSDNDTDPEDANKKKLAPSRNGVEIKDAIDEQLVDFLKEIDAISAATAAATSLPPALPPALPPPVQDVVLQALVAGEIPPPPPPPEEDEGPAAPQPPPPGEPSLPQGEGGVKEEAQGEAGAVEVFPGCPWVECLDEGTGYAYFWNQVTNEVTWECPPEYEALWTQAALQGGTGSLDASRAEAASATAAAAAAAAAAREVEAATGVNSGEAISAADVAQPGLGVAGASASVNVEEASLENGVAVRVETREVRGGSPVVAAKKRKAEPEIGKIIPITSYGSSDGSSSEESNGDSSPRKPSSSSRRSRLPTKRRKASHKVAGASSPVYFGPQLPPGLPTEPVVFGPQLPEMSMIGPQLPETSMIGPQLPETFMIGPQLPEASVIGPQLPEASVIGPQSPEASIGPQLPEASMIGPQLPEASMIGPQLPEEQTIGPQLPEEPTIGPQLPEVPTIGPQFPEVVVSSGAASNLSASGLDALSLSPNLVSHGDIHKPQLSDVSVEQSERSPASDADNVAGGLATSALAALLDYPGSPAAEEESPGSKVALQLQEEHADMVPKAAAATAMAYPVMVGAKFQFGSTEEIVTEDASPALHCKSLSIEEKGGEESLSLLSSKTGTTRKSSSQASSSENAKGASLHLVSYGDSESSEEESNSSSMAEPPSPCEQSGRKESATPDNTEAAEDGISFGGHKQDSSPPIDDSRKTKGQAGPFSKISFVRSDEVLVLAEVTGKTIEDVTAPETEEQRAEAEDGEGSLGSGNELDDFDDVERALDIALMESRRREAEAKMEKEHDAQSGCPKLRADSPAKEPAAAEVSEPAEPHEGSPYREAVGAFLKAAAAIPEVPEKKARERKKWKEGRPSSPKATKEKTTREVLALTAEIECANASLMDRLGRLKDDGPDDTNAFRELLVQMRTRMEDWRAGALEPAYLLRKLREAQELVPARLQQGQRQRQRQRSTDFADPPLPPGWQKHWDRTDETTTTGPTRRLLFPSDSCRCKHRTWAL